MLISVQLFRQHIESKVHHLLELVVHCSYVYGYAHPVFVFCFSRK